jgi:hypothetical protein
MTDSDKKKTAARIRNLRDDRATNLWSGVKAGIEMFAKSEDVDNLQAMFLLTDGQPNQMCPAQGYVAKMHPLLQNTFCDRRTTPIINTFGFGYSIRSELMQSIAEVGRGSYSFIPDAGMIGTAFVHSIANLYSTLGTMATIDIEVSDGHTLTATAGLALTSTEHGQTMALGNVQYGQSRDLVFLCPEHMPETARITASLTYKVPNGSTRSARASVLHSEETALHESEIQYHMRRSQVCGYLASLYPLKENGEHSMTSDKEQIIKMCANVKRVASAIKDSRLASEPGLHSLFEDISGAAPHGQIAQALQNADTGRHGVRTYWTKWGRHYLSSLLHAHQRQACNSFKDPGPLQYGKDSPLFIKCRDELDAAFDRLPPPKPSRPEKIEYIHNAWGKVIGARKVPHGTVSMSSYNSASVPCFEGNSLIRTDNGDRVPVKSLRPGMSVWTPIGARAIIAILRTTAKNQRLCRLGELLVTPWHPIYHAGQWVFPNNIARSFRFSGSVYSVLLAPHADADGHAIEIGGKIAVTLGHGFTVRNKGDVRGHGFFGSYAAVAKSLGTLPVDKNGHFRCGGLLRSKKTGLASGFLRLEGHSWRVSVKRPLARGISGRMRLNHVA